MKNIIVASHRRSGTHLTIDSIISNLVGFNRYLSLDTLTESDIDIDFLKELEQGGLVFKTHADPNEVKALGDNDFRKKIYESSEIIYVIRDGRDVMVSLYEYRKRHDHSFAGVPFTKFIHQKNDYSVTSESEGLTRLEYWRYHVIGWMGMDPKPVVMNYETWIADYKNAIKELSVKTSIEQKSRITDLRQTNRFLVNLKKAMSKLTKRKSLTAVEFNKGKVGEYKNYFSDTDLSYFDEKISITSF